MKKLVLIAIVGAIVAVNGCKNGQGYSVGGTLTGLTGTGLVLQDNSGDNLSLSSNGTFAFSSGVDNGDAYSVTVATQPSNPTQTCTVHNGSGTIDGAAIINVVVSCTQAGQFAYVANQLSNTISAYIINSSTGYLTPVEGSPFAATGTTPVSLAVDPNGEFLYVANQGSNDVSVYAIDGATGAITPSGVPIQAGNAPVAVTVDPSDNFVFVANLADNTVSVFSLDGSTGVLTAVTGSPSTVALSAVKPWRTIRTAAGGG